MAVQPDHGVVRLPHGHGQGSPPRGRPPLTVWTVGHSTRPAEEFRELLAAHEIELVIDVRRFPASRRFPHFTGVALRKDLEAAGTSYLALPALGGRRLPVPESGNDAWRHPAFRGYADYLATEDFAAGLFELLLVVRGLRSAIMCAELLWWRCHRRIIADLLVSSGIQVVHIRDAGESELHRLSAPARLVRGRLTYAAGTR